MATNVIVPKLGMSTAPLTLVEWKVKEGDQVEQGSVVLLVETVKVTHDVEAKASGFIHILVEAGSKAPIGTVAGLIAETKEELETLQKETPKEEATPTAEVEEASSAETAPVQAVVSSAAQAAGAERIRISPVARKLAAEHMVDITSMVGTGPGGRIVRDDIEKAIGAKGKEEVTPVAYQGKRVKSVIPLTGMRKAIAEHMHRSLSSSAQLTLCGEIDMTETVKLRESLVNQEKVIGARITYTDIFVFVIAKLLKGNPIFNSSLIEDEIKVWEDINVGVAVALEEGLIVPVVKGADKKSLVEINQTIRALVDKARSGSLTLDEVTDGTFTITNVGALGGGYRFETVVINQPESAILGTGGITDRVVARDGQIVIRPIMTYYLTYDHRVINGAAGAEFMTGVTRLLENPNFWLV
ncbi:dihydrolipoamide acetyltransferase family protein [Chloroflexota bacterium]